MTIRAQPLVLVNELLRLVVLKMATRAAGLPNYFGRGLQHMWAGSMASVAGFVGYALKDLQMAVAAIVSCR